MYIMGEGEIDCACTINWEADTSQPRKDNRVPVLMFCLGCALSRGEEWEANFLVPDTDEDHIRRSQCPFLDKQVRVKINPRRGTTGFSICNAGTFHDIEEEFGQE